MVETLEFQIYAVITRERKKTTSTQKVIVFTSVCHVASVQHTVLN